jgi:hypothetical protein
LTGLLITDEYLAVVDIIINQLIRPDFNLKSHRDVLINIAAIRSGINFNPLSRARLIYVDLHRNFVSSGKTIARTTPTLQPFV